MDGKELGEYDGVSNPRYSPDGEHLTYETGKRRSSLGVVRDAIRLVVDGKPGPEAVGFGDRAYTGDGKHFALVAITDARPGTPCVQGIQPQCDPVNPGGKSVVILDGQAGAQYNFILPGSLHFGPDGVLEFLAVQRDGNYLKTAVASLYRVRYTPTGK